METTPTADHIYFNRIPGCLQTDHQILLHLGAGPIQIKPYQYLQFQKSEIVCLVKSMLAEGA